MGEEFELYDDDDDFLSLDDNYCDERGDDDEIHSDVFDGENHEESENDLHPRLIDIDEDIGKRGYTKMHHFLIESLILQHLSGCEYAIVLLLLRMTTGFGRKETYLANSFIIDKTRYDKNHISASLKKLRERNIVIRTREAKYGCPAFYRLNDSIGTWR